MVDKSTVLQIFGALMKHPQYLSETDKYSLTPDDFYYKLDKYIFVAIDSLYRNGATRIQPIDVENYLKTNESATVVFKQQKGIEYLQDADYLTTEENFPYYYKRLKKFNLLQCFKNKGIDVSDFYVEDALTQKALEVNEKFEPYGNTFLYQLEDINDIVDLNEKEVLGIQKKYGGIDSLVLNIIDTSNYKILRKNEIKYKDDSNNRLYISLPFHKWGENKLIGGGADSIFIFGLDTLELETTISFDKNIKNILVRPKGNIFLYLVADEKSKDMNLYKEANCYSLFYYLNEAKIDFKKNELKSYKEELINDYCKAHEDLFFIYNYVNNGLITLTDKTEIIIYDDFGDSNE